MDNLTPNPMPEETPNPSPDSSISRMIQAIIVATLWVVFVGIITWVLGFVIFGILSLFEPIFYLLNLLNISYIDLLNYSIMVWLVLMPLLWIQIFIDTISGERGK